MAEIYTKYDKDIRVMINPESLSRKLKREVYEEDTKFVIDSVVKQGNVCFDVGANVGGITLLLAKRVGQSGKVYAFEPAIKSFIELCGNILINPLLKNSIIPMKTGIGNEKKELLCVSHSYNKGNSSLKISDECEGKNLEDIETVAVYPLDSLFEKYPLSRLDFMKIDVEGMELEAVQGAAKLIQKFRPAIYYETIFVHIYNDALTKEHYSNTEKIRDSYSEIEKILTDMDYRLYRTDNQVFERASFPDYSNNILALPQEKEFLIKPNLKNT